MWNPRRGNVHTIIRELLVRQENKNTRFKTSDLFWFEWDTVLIGNNEYWSELRLSEDISL